MHSSAGQRRSLPTARRCALCPKRLSVANNSREHIIPNAIGGRKTIRDFLCKECNSGTGANWDSQLVSQLRPICVMLDIRRQRGTNQPVPVETAGDEQLLLHADGSMSIPRPRVSESHFDGKTVINIQARSRQELTRMIPGLAKKYPTVDWEKVAREAEFGREVLKDPWRLSVDGFGGDLAGRAIVKSCLALAYEAGLRIEDCENAKSYLLADGEPCFGYFNEIDVIRNRPPGTFPHCVYVCGDPSARQVLAYVEYFGYQRIVACLSSQYEGEPFSSFYALDPVSGKELDVDIELEISPEDIPAIYANEKFDANRQRAMLEELVAASRDRHEKAAIANAAKDAIDFAIAACGFQPGQELSEMQAADLIAKIQKKLEPFLLRLWSSRRFSPHDLRRIRAKEERIARAS